jgi:hypothetical protein
MEEEVNSCWMNFKETIKICKLKEEVVDRTPWRTDFGRDCGQGQLFFS